VLDIYDKYVCHNSDINAQKGARGRGRWYVPHVDVKEARWMGLKGKVALRGYGNNTDTYIKI
jgi:hypothetical protein